MTDEASWREGRRSVLGDERDVTESGEKPSGPSREEDTLRGRLTVEAYDEGLERHFELSSLLAFLRRQGETETEQYATLRSELTELDRELSAMSLELSLSEIGALLEDPRDDGR